MQASRQEATLPKANLNINKDTWADILNRDTEVATNRDTEALHPRVTEVATPRAADITNSSPSSNTTFSKDSLAETRVV